MLLVLFLNFIYAIGYPMTKAALKHGEPLFLTALCMFIGGSGLLGYQYYVDRTAFTVPRNYFMPLFLSGIFNSYLTNFFELYGIMRMDSSIAAFMFNLSPFIAAIMGYLFYKETLNVTKWSALIIACFGLLFIIGADSHDYLFDHVLYVSWPEIALLCANVSTVYGSFILQDFVRNKSYSSFMTNGLTMLIGGGFAIAHSVFAETWNPVPAYNLWPYVGWLLVMVLLFNFLTYEMYTYFSRFYTITFLNLSGFTIPLFTVLIDWIWYGTTASWRFWTASAFVFFGLYLFYKDEKNK